MKRFVRMMAVIGMTAAAAPAPALATTLAPLTHDQMVDAADLIVEGTVLSVKTVVDEHGHVWTQASVRVESAMKGGAKAGDTLLVESAGGVIESGEAVNIPSAPRFAADEHVLLYLVSHRFGAAYGTVGMQLGKFTIKQNPADGSDMVVRFSVPYPRVYDARFLPNPPLAERVSLRSMETAIHTRVEQGWDGQPIPGVPASHLREINKLQPGVK